MNFAVDGAEESRLMRSVVAAPDFEAGLHFFVDELEFKIVMISPADDPNYAILKKDHYIIALDKHADTPPLTIEIPVKDQLKFGTVIVGPNGTNIRYTSVAGSHEQKERHDPIFSLSRLSDAEWVHGRAGMSYRALNGSNSEISSASQIRIKGSGTVPDWVHYHDVSFQTLFCINGSATLVYEDQGEPFLFAKGDCILQPPGIRHQVLESFDDLEVIEFSSPSIHATFSDFDLKLPNSKINPDRVFAGQKFSCSTSDSRKASLYSESDSLEVLETPIDMASGSVGWVNEICGCKESNKQFAPLSPRIKGQPSFLLWFVKKGFAEIQIAERTEVISAGDAISYPYGFNSSLEFSLLKHDADFEVLEVGFYGE